MDARLPNMEELAFAGPTLVVLATANDGSPTPLGALTALLAEGIVTEFCDAVSVMVVRVEGQPEPPAGPKNLTWIPLAVSPIPSVALQQVLAKAKEVGPSYAYTFIDTSSLGWSFTEALIDTLGHAKLDGLQRRLVRLTHHLQGVSRPNWDVLWTVLLPSDIPKAGASAPALAELLVQRTTPVGEPYQVASLRPAWCRVRVDLSGAKPVFARASLARWARAVTHRRVGLALGGSGAWGYMHVVLMAEMIAHQIPIDVISGASSGSLFGAYYAVKGEEGLEIAVERGLRFSVMCVLSMLSTGFLQGTVALDLGPTRLEDLEVIFLPVTTNISQLCTDIVQHDTVSFGVRASGSAPGFFGPTVAGGSVLVDGAVIDNVPAAIVRKTGADLCIASNPLPSAEGVTAPGGILGFLFTMLNPLARINSLRTSFALMFHQVGDAEAWCAPIQLNPKPVPGPLFDTFDFYRAKEIVKVAAAQPDLQRAVTETVAAWALLRAPRSGSVTSGTALETHDQRAVRDAAADTDHQHAIAGLDRAIAP